MKRNFKYIFVLILLAVAVISWREAFGRDRDKLKFYMLDVGQGDAIFIETPSGNQILLDGGDNYNLAEYGELKKLMEEKKIKYEVARRGLKISLDKGISLLVLAPDKLIKSDNPHDNNVVSRLSYGRIDFLLMGDGEKGEELKLVQAGDNLESEVLKVGHHGSK